MENHDLYQVLRQHDAGHLSLFDVYDWISSREEHWAALPATAPERQAADTIMLAMYELDAGDRDKKSVDTIVRQAFRDLAAAQRV